MSHFIYQQPKVIFYHFTAILFFHIFTMNCFAVGITISGIVKDIQGNFIQGAKVVFRNNVFTYTTSSNADGSYQIVIPATGVDQISTSELSTGSNFPNPFSEKTAIPVQIHKQGTLLFSVYNLIGQKIKEVTYKDLIPGVYNIEWDGTDQNLHHLAPGVYVYVIHFNGKQYTGKAIKSDYGQNYTGESLPMTTASRLKSVPVDSASIFLSDISHNGYFRSSRGGIVIKRDTVVNFILTPFANVPFKTEGNHLAYLKQDNYLPLFIKGINLGSSPPGYWPGEIGYAISDEQYERWINRIGQMGFNTIRVYTLHPPVFYQKLANYNEQHPGKPLYLFQGIWMEDVASATTSEYNLFDRTSQFEAEIESVIKSVHGDLNIPERAGKAYGNYKTDVSQWIISYNIGREVYPEEVETTNKYNPTVSSFDGIVFSISGVTPTEAWMTARVDKVVNFENHLYKVQRPVSFLNWPSLDPLNHPSENGYEDLVSVDLNNINTQNAPAGFFALYHVYPYFPNFINDDPPYRMVSDAYGVNPYLAYITELRNHYTKIPLIIGEFGVPSSWGNAHQTISGMSHGGLSEEQQGNADMRMFRNIWDSGCAGGFLFEWMDEWFKTTWIVQYQESLGFMAGSVFIPTRQSWPNICSPEENFGLLSFDQTDPPLFTSYQIDKSNGIVSDMKASNDDRFFYLEVDLSSDINTNDTLWIAFDTYRADLGESILPNKLTVNNRSEFTLQIAFSKDTALWYVTQKYNNYGLSLKFNLADTNIQKFRSLPTDGEPWVLMRWRNDLAADANQDIGKIPMVNTLNTAANSLTGVYWQQRKIKIRMPWTMLYFSNPMQSEVINGFDLKGQPVPIRATSDGIAISVAKGNYVVNTTSRYTWPSWIVVHPTTEREKASLKIVEQGLSGFSDVPK